MLAVDALGVQDARVLFAYDPADTNVFVATFLFSPTVCMLMAFQLAAGVFFVQSCFRGVPCSFNAD